MLRRSKVMSPKDSVAVLLENAQKGDSIKLPQGEIVLLEDIEFAHKVAIVDFAAKAPVYKYGVEIGYMENATPKGTWIHNHNMMCDRGRKAGH
ncbi:MAG: UxaA family hydrolase [Negativicutes bacterium]|nr:UxaA family hydrolase [Negativicutes bacterium]